MGNHDWATVVDYFGGGGGFEVMIEGSVRMSIVFDVRAAGAMMLVKPVDVDNAAAEPVTSITGSMPVAAVKSKLIMVMYPFIF